MKVLEGGKPKPLPVGVKVPRKVGDKIAGDLLAFSQTKEDVKKSNNIAKLIDVLDTGTAVQEFNKNHKGPGPGGGQFTSGGVGGDIITRQNLRVTVMRDPEVTSPDVVQRVDKLIDDIPEGALRSIEARTIKAYDNKEDADEEIRKRYPDEYNESSEMMANGSYDRDSRHAIVSMWSSEDASESGRNLYHELAHSMTARIEDGKWESVAQKEWQSHGSDEGFATAFSDFTIARRNTKLGAEQGIEDMKWFSDNHPETAKLFTETWGWK